MRVKILFVCHGNICRSPMAEFILKDMVSKAGLTDRFEIASAAVSREEIGNPVYPPARRELAAHGSLVYTNVGVSMRPLIRQGRDLLVIRTCTGRLRPICFLTSSSDSAPGTLLLLFSSATKLFC